MTIQYSLAKEQTTFPYLPRYPVLATLEPWGLPVPEYLPMNPSGVWEPVTPEPGWPVTESHSGILQHCGSLVSGTRRQPKGTLLNDAHLSGHTTATVKAKVSRVQSNSGRARLSFSS